MYFSLNSSLGVKLLRHANILLVLFEEGLQIELAVALVASDSLIVVDLLGLVLVAGVLQTPVELVS